MTNRTVSYEVDETGYTVSVFRRGKLSERAAFPPANAASTPLSLRQHSAIP